VASRLDHLLDAVLDLRSHGEETMKFITAIWFVILAFFLVLTCGISHCQDIDAPLPWHKTLDWKFAAVHAGYFSAMMFDQHRTLQGEARGCALEQGDNGPYYATRGDLMKQNMPFFGGIVVADMFLRKYWRGGGRFNWMVAPAVASSKHLYAASQWCH